MLWTQTFSEYGSTLSHTGTIGSALGFTGNWTDPDTGLVHLRARDYDPATGQFLKVDPALEDTRQPYTYAANNPLQLTDHLGLDPRVGSSDGIASGVGPTLSPAELAFLCGPSAQDTDQSWAVAVWRKLTNALLPYTMITDELAKQDWYRTIANAPVSVGAAAYALANGGRCGLGPSVMLVCQVESWDYGGGTTYGSTFITAANLGNTIDDEKLMRHETGHARQWAAQGPAPMIAGYVLSSGYSQLVTGSYACANIYEWDAGLVSGGYSDCLK